MALDQEVVGSNPGTVPILDGCKQFASYYIKENLKIKVAKWGTPKKIFKKYYYSVSVISFSCFQSDHIKWQQESKYSFQSGKVIKHVNKKE